MNESRQETTLWYHELSRYQSISATSTCAPTPRSSARSGRTHLRRFASYREARRTHRPNGVARSVRRRVAPPRWTLRIGCACRSDRSKLRMTGSVNARGVFRPATLLTKRSHSLRSTSRWSSVTASTACRPNWLPKPASGSGPQQRVGSRGRQCCSLASQMRSLKTPQWTRLPRR